MTKSIDFVVGTKMRKEMDLTCKEAVTDPTTELEVSDRKTTLEVPYLLVMVVTIVQLCIPDIVPH